MLSSRSKHIESHFHVSVYQETRPGALLRLMSIVVRDQGWVVREDPLMHIRSMQTRKRCRITTAALPTPTQPPFASVFLMQEYCILEGLVGRIRLLHFPAIPRQVSAFHYDAHANIPRFGSGVSKVQVTIARVRVTCTCGYHGLVCGLFEAECILRVAIAPICLWVIVRRRSRSVPYSCCSTGWYKYLSHRRQRRQRTYPSISSF